MRRLSVLALTLAVALGGLAVVRAASGSSHDSTYRVDVIFDNARGLVAGQLVEIAGARVGSITDVTVTADYKARVQMQVDPRFGPFRSDATCSIRPQGLIAENSVLCDPGSPSAGPLAAVGDQHPTVPVAHTTEPVNLTDLFNIWDRPTRERLTVLTSELGLGISARGEDINAILLRANPTLALAGRVIAILRHQHAQLASSIDSTGAVLAALAARAGSVHDFIGHAADVTAITGTHAGSLASAIHNLPALLATAQPALIQLDAVARSGTPLLGELRASAPALDRLGNDLPAFAAAAGPALTRMGETLDRGVGVVKAAVPTSTALATYARQSLPTAKLSGRTLVNLRNAGLSESLLSFFYYATAATARFDNVSHILPSHAWLTQCGQYTATPVAGCSANYSATTAAARSHPASGSVAPAGAGGSAAAGQPSPPSSGPPAAAPPPAQAPAGGQPLQGIQNTATQTIQNLLSQLPPAVQHLLPQPSGGTRPGPPAQSPNSVDSLLKYLLR